MTSSAAPYITFLSPSVFLFSLSPCGLTHPPMPMPMQVVAMDDPELSGMVGKRSPTPRPGSAIETGPLQQPLLDLVFRYPFMPPTTPIIARSYH